eukprot:CAMPEP_0206444934 /NCGR_PEP_ID=MMETSP0324_2-20121206/15197_1 /ASSEMBLY_ACC=CAM_ASM_000836 /TAXON_ID=2866 /ORGANISM="Crypthecodinium cohnii, Strain Seligo" /LENGTH=813 /DNA_ID=CAMNT_0053913031 /DNA_START=236 /DNA_END=2677 /DNA_ORIENTATION=+
MVTGASGQPVAKLRSSFENHPFDEWYSCDTLCDDLPYTFWNTCPLCFCGLLPVLVLVFSAAFRLDYATHVTDIGAEIINDFGLSYTVYYTAGCLPPEEDGRSDVVKGYLEELEWRQQASRKPQCNTEHFEVASAEFDAVTGSLLKVHNVTNLHARKVDAVKVTPDWRFILFAAALANDVGNLYVVPAEQRETDQTVPILSESQLDAMDQECQDLSDSVLKVMLEGSTSFSSSPSSSESGQKGVAAPRVARLAGFKHLQVIIPGVPPIESGEDLDAPLFQDASEGLSSLVYRAAFAFRCQEVLPVAKADVHPIKFSRLAVVDFRLEGLNEFSLERHRWLARAKSDLQLVESHTVNIANDAATSTLEPQKLKSQACPRFVPSAKGSRLLFVTEDPTPQVSRTLDLDDLDDLGSWKNEQALPRKRWLALSEIFKSSSLLEQQHLQNLTLQRSAEWRSRLSGGPLLNSRQLDETEASTASAAEGSESPLPTTSAKLTATMAAAVAPFLTTETAKSTTTVMTTTKAATSAAPPAHLSGSFTNQQLHPEVRRSESPPLLLELDVGQGGLPRAPIRGCPEFVPSLYVTTEDPKKHDSVGLSETDAAASTRKRVSVGGDEGHLVPTRKFRDTFVVVSEPSSSSVLHVQPQMLTAALAAGDDLGSVESVRWLYDVTRAPFPEDLESILASVAGSTESSTAGKKMLSAEATSLHWPEQPLSLAGCQPIRAAGRQGHVRLAWISETLMKSFNLRRSGADEYSTWLACLTADQKIAIVSSGKRDQWVNMSMPYPMWTGRSVQDLWCSPESEEACFEVWSNPNPHD